MGMVEKRSREDDMGVADAYRWCDQGVRKTSST